MMNGAGSAPVDWHRGHGIDAVGRITFGPLKYEPRRHNEPVRPLPPIDKDVWAAATLRIPDREPSLAARISAAICKLDALRAELVAIKAAL